MTKFEYWRDHPIVHPPVHFVCRDMQQKCCICSYHACQYTRSSMWCIYCRADIPVEPGRRFCTKAHAHEYYAEQKAYLRRRKILECDII